MIFVIIKLAMPFKMKWSHSNGSLLSLEVI
uniref:Uncharacterized protein n=1 Tax=Siphoviridae sp. ctwWa4 TaxID=2826517 RepID=A0A8S5NBL1_9CAUD|nr:MAG TPA: hypothetical protein [Siphoviridae sp. ctwWa4]